MFTTTFSTFITTCSTVNQITKLQFHFPGAQQYDNFGKIFTVKLQFIFYKERPGVRPGQVTKAERITNKLSQFAAYAIQGDYQGVKEFGSDLRKLGLPVEHAPQVNNSSMNFSSLIFNAHSTVDVLCAVALFRFFFLSEKCRSADSVDKSRKVKSQELPI